MAIQLEFINLIVPIQRIRELYPGCHLDHYKCFGKVVWYDDHLFRTGAKDPDIVNVLIDKWTGLGFTATEVIDGRTVWKDFCVVTSYGVSQYDCPWIVVDPESRTAWLKGIEPGECVGRDCSRQ